MGGGRKVDFKFTVLSIYKNNIGIYRDYVKTQVQKKRKKSHKER